MKKSTGFASVAMLFLCTGCITNNYERFYVDSACERNFEPTRGDAPVIAGWRRDGVIAPYRCDVRTRGPI